MSDHMGQRLAIPSVVFLDQLGPSQPRNWWLTHGWTWIRQEKLPNGAQRILPTHTHVSKTNGYCFCLPLLHGRKAMTNLDSVLKSRDVILPTKGPYGQSYGFSSSHVWMWELDHKEGWATKNLCFWTMVLEKTLQSPLDCKEIQLVNPKGNQSWIFIGKTDAEAESPVLWPPDAKSWLIGKDPDVGKDWRQEEKGMTEDEMVGWHHQLNEREFEQTPRNGDRQQNLVCGNQWGS